MARKIKKQYQVTATLEALTPIHVGGINDNTLVDLALALDGRGRYYLPGSSLAGALRSWMTDTMGGELSDRLFGPQKTRTSGKNNGNNDGYASFIFIEDAIIEESLTEEIRDGVGIDRQWGTAADKIKFDRAILPRGTTFDLELTAGLPADSKWGLRESDVLNVLSALIEALKAGEIYLGAAKTRGLGKVKIKGEAEIKAVDLLTPKGILDSLRGEGDPPELPNITGSRPQLLFEIKWKPEGPVMVKAEPDGLAVNILPLTSAVGEELALVLPGSSVKGAIRFQAERILRTLGVKEIPPGPPSEGGKSISSSSASETEKSKQKFFNRLELPLVRTIFGTAKTADGKKTEDKNRPLPGLGALLVNDCYSEKTISSNRWQAIATATKDKELRKALDDAELTKTTQQAYHVAIDRWTGGAAETMLYSGLEPFDVKWNKLCLTLDLNRIPEEEVLVAIAFLLIIIRDLFQKRIPLGYGVNRGYGSIVVGEVGIKAKGLGDREDFKIFESGVTLENGDITELDSSVLNRLDEEWKNWIKKNVENETKEL